MKFSTLLRATLLASAAFLLHTGIAHANTRSHSAILSRGEVHRELRQHSIHQVETKDNRYVVPSHTWLVREFLPYYKSYLFQTFAEYTPEGLDCDNYCVFFQSTLFVANVQGGGTRSGEVPAGVLWSQPPNQRAPHVQIVIRTDRGWNVVEPQNGRMVRLADYKRHNRIIKVIF